MRRKRGVTTKAATLARIPLFEHVPGSQLERFAVAAEDLDMPPGRVLCQEGRSAREFFVIIEGEAEATKGSEHVRRLGPGDFFGGVELIEHTLRATTVRALTPLRVFVFSARGFWSLMHENPELERKVLRALVLENVVVREIAE